VTIDSIRVALRGMLANRMRSLLTMLGILIGTAAVILLVAVGTGISNLVQHQIETLGSNAVYVFPQQSRGGQDRGGTNARRIRLTQTDVDALSDRTNAPSIINVAPTVQTNATAVADGTTYALQNLIGATPNYMEVRNATLQAGRHFDEADMANHAKVAVMGQTVADGLWGKGFNPVGQQVSFNGVRFRIVGLLEKKGSSGIGDQDDVVIAPLSTVRATLVGNVDSYTLIAIQAASRQHTDSAQAEAIRILRSTHKLGPGQPLDFQIFNQASLLKTGQQAALVFSLLLAAVAAISLFVGGAAGPHRRRPGRVRRRRLRPAEGRPVGTGGLTRFDRRVVRRVGPRGCLLRRLPGQPRRQAHPDRGPAVRVTTGRRPG
jgi:putative ABC transport system permease protein